MFALTLTIYQLLVIISTHGGHFALQGHRFWYQSKARMQLPISE